MSGLTLQDSSKYVMGESKGKDLVHFDNFICNSGITLYNNVITLVFLKRIKIYLELHELCHMLIYR